MSEFEGLPACQFPGCAQPAVGGDWTAPEVCARHLALAASDQRRRMMSMQRRSAVIEALWADPIRYDAIVASGRYLKLVHAKQCADEAMRAATERFMRSIYANVYPSPRRAVESGWRASA